MKVFVTGGTGFVGNEILRQLKAAGHRIRLLARNADSQGTRKLAEPLEAEIHAGNVLDPTSLDGACTGVDAVIHLVGIIGEAGENTFENIHVRGTANVIHAARAGRVRQFVQMSALGTRPNAVSRYHQTKFAAEEIVRQSGLPYTILRPSIIYGAGDHFVNLFARISRISPVLVVMGTGTGTLQPVPVQDVAKCFVRALAEPRAIDATFDVCSSEVLTFDEVLDSITGVLERKRLKVHMPSPLAQIIARISEFVFSKALKKPPPFNRDSLIMLEEKMIGDCRPAQQLFEIDPPQFREGIRGWLTG